jgi:hypothetical protein
MELLLLSILIFMGFPILLLFLKSKAINWKFMFIIIIIGFVLLLYLSYGVLLQDITLLEGD